MKHLLSFIFSILLTCNLIAQTPQGNRGLYFDGVDDVVNIPANASLNFAGSDNYTVEMWVKVPKVSATTFQNLAVKQNGGGCQLTIVLTLIPNGTLGFATDEVSCGGWDYGESPANVILPNQWTHLAFVSNAGIKEIYVNGLAQLVTFPNGGSSLPAPSASSSNTPWNFGITGGWGCGFFNGQIDEVRIYNSALSQTQIQADMASLSGTGTAVYYNFNELNGQTIINNGGTVGVSGNGTLGASALPADDANDPLRAFRVTNTGNIAAAGLGSLRQAITEANLFTDTNYIDFSIQQTNPTTISTISPIATLDITNPVIIDGYSAFGALPNTNTSLANGTNAQLRVEIDFINLPNNVAATGVNGIELTNAGANNASNSIIRGLSIYNVKQPPSPATQKASIYIWNNSNNCKVEGCFIGVKADGTPTTPTNNSVGIAVQIVTNTIIGGNIADANVISNQNGNAGINIDSNNTGLLQSYKITL